MRALNRFYSLRFVTSKVFPLLLILILLQSGCSRIRQYDVVVYPDSPMMIQQVQGNQAKVFIYSEELNQLVDYGWVNLKDAKGWTLTKFDWAAYIERNSNGE